LKRTAVLSETFIGSLGENHELLVNPPMQGPFSILRRVNDAPILSDFL